MALVTAGCKDDPWAFAPAPPSDADRVERWAWSVRDTVVGIEERSFGTTDAGRWASLRTTFAFREGGVRDTGRPSETGRERWVRRALFVRCTARVCTGDRLESDGSQERLSGTCAPELFAPSVDRCVPLGGGDTTMERQDDTLRFNSSTGVVRVGLDDLGTPAWIEAGGLRGERITEPVELQPVDVAALTAQPVPRFETARTAHVGRFIVDGRPLRIDVPTTAELPPRDVARVNGLMERVAEELPGDSGCKEHAAALVAAARRAGYAARTVFGRVYVDSEQAGAMVLHAWAELEIGGRWVGADSAFHQFPADASHVPLARQPDDLVASDAEISVVELR